MWHMLFYVAFLIYFFFNKLAEQNPKTKEKKKLQTFDTGHF